MQIRSINHSNVRQSFGMRIPHTNALGEVIRSWRINNLTQKDINKKLSILKKSLPDTFELKIDKFNSTNGIRAGKVQYSIIYKDGNVFSGNTASAPYDFIKSIKAVAGNAKEQMIKLKGKKAVTGKGPI